ncbi:hypothetical protein ALI44B_12255 [Leifsonia sp. ALI-44-B]|nr:hypothetical protein ALI44B_12255 [Leifsonia sp. ALI-44-B]
MKNMQKKTRTTTALAALLAGGLALTGCASGALTTSTPSASSADSHSDSAGSGAIAVSYDGGIYLLDPETLEVTKDIPLDGFNRLNPAGDDRHLFVSTSSGFTLLDAEAGELTDQTFGGEKPGHVVRHEGRTVLFTDGTGEVEIFDTHDIEHASDDGAGALEPEETYKTADAHHGVAVELANGELVVTLGTEESRPGIIVLDENRTEIARNEDCLGVHGEATAEDEAVVIGCESGVLIYQDGEITKVPSPDAYGRIGNQAGSDQSPITLGDYKTDKDAELERPERISLIDTRTKELKLVDLGTSYSFRSLARGPHGEGLVLGTDGAIHVIDPEAGTVENSIPVIAEWSEPLDWQQPRPTIFVRDHVAYVTEPASKKIHAVDIESGEILTTATLPEASNELSGVLAH